MPHDDGFSTQIKLTMTLRLGMIQNEALPHLSYEQFENALWKIKWSEGYPKHIHQIIDDIMRLSAEEIVSHLSTQSVIESRHQTLSDFSTLFGG
jgi:hypothetical protein